MCINKKNNNKMLKRHYIIAFWITLTVSLSLIIGGFFCPPIGEISGSVLTAVGEVFLWPALAFGAKALEEENHVTMKRGEFKIEVGKETNGQDNE